MLRAMARASRRSRSERTGAGVMAHTSWRSRSACSPGGDERGRGGAVWGRGAPSDGARGAARRAGSACRPGDDERGRGGAVEDVVRLAMARAKRRLRSSCRPVMASAVEAVVGNAIAMQAQQNERLQ